MKAETLVTLFVPRPINYRDGRVEIIEHRLTAHSDFVSIPGSSDEEDRRVVVRRVWDPWRHLASHWATARLNCDAHHKFGYWRLEANR